MSSSPERQRQAGGTATIIINEYTSNCANRGSNIQKMGRWSWVTIKDTRGEIKTTIITIYQPVRNVDIETVLTQQASKIRKDSPHIMDIIHELYVRQGLRGSCQRKDRRQPSNHFDGRFQYQHRQTKGEDSINDEQVWYKQCHSEETQNPNSNKAQQNQTLGWDILLKNIPIINGGHRPGDISLSDHKLVWVGIPTHTIVGEHKAIVRPANIELQADHPGIQKQYNRLLEKQFKMHSVGKLTKDLERATINKDKEIYQVLYKKLDWIRPRVVKYAESKCTKQKRGQVPFSPELTKLSGEIII